MSYFITGLENGISENVLFDRYIDSHYYSVYEITAA